MEAEKFRSSLTSYKEMYFDEAFGHRFKLYNQNFYIKLEALKDKYPSMQTRKILVFKFGTFYQDIEVVTNSPEIRSAYDKIYNQHYSLEMKKLYPEYENREDIFQDLKNNDM